MADPVRKSPNKGVNDTRGSSGNIVHPVRNEVSNGARFSNGACLQITSKKLQADIALIKLKGNVMNVDNYYKLHKIINTVLDYGVYKIIVDLSELRYMTSMGMSILVHAGLVALEHKGRVVLVNPQPKVKTILDLIGITEVCGLANNLTNAFKVLGVNQKLFGELERKAREP